MSISFISSSPWKLFPFLLSALFLDLNLNSFTSITSVIETWDTESGLQLQTECSYFVPSRSLILFSFILDWIFVTLLTPLINTNSSAFVDPSFDPFPSIGCWLNEGTQKNSIVLSGYNREWVKRRGKREKMIVWVLSFCVVGSDMILHFKWWILICIPFFLFFLLLFSFDPLQPFPFTLRNIFALFCDEPFPLIHYPLILLCLKRRLACKQWWVWIVDTMHHFLAWIVNRQNIF